MSSLLSSLHFPFRRNSPPCFRHPAAPIGEPASWRAPNHDTFRSPRMMTSPTFKQRRPRHAITEFSAAMSFFQPLTPPTFAKAVNELRAYASESNLPAVINRQVISFPAGTPQGPVSFQPAGWQRFAANGEPEVTVLCDEGTIQFSTRNYSTWVEIRETLANFFERLSRIYASEVPAVTAFQIAYLNEFDKEAPGFNSGAEVFRENSEWLVPNVSRFEDAWHSHVGWYERVSINRRRLVNVNAANKTQASPITSEPLTVVSSLFLIAEKYDILGESPLIIPLNLLRQQIVNHLDEAHEREKEILKQVVSDPYLRHMGVS